MKAMGLAVVLAVSACARPQPPPALPSNVGTEVAPPPSDRCACGRRPLDTARYAVRLKYLECRVDCLKQQVWNTRAKVALACD